MTTNNSKSGSALRIDAFKAHGSAQSGEQAALLNCFRVVAATGPTSDLEVAEARGWYGKNADGQPVPSTSCAPYASMFNRAAKVSAVLGIPATIDLIDAAAKGSTDRVRESVSDALGAALALAKGDNVKEATKREAKAIAKRALVQVAEKAAERKAIKVAGHKRGTKSPDSATMAAAAIQSGKSARDMGAALRLISNQASKLSAPEGREDAWRAALASLQSTCEAFAVFK